MLYTTIPLYAFENSNPKEPNQIFKRVNIDSVDEKQINEKSKETNKDFKKVNINSIYVNEKTKEELNNLCPDFKYKNPDY